MKACIVVAAAAFCTGTRTCNMNDEYGGILLQGLTRFVQNEHYRMTSSCCLLYAQCTIKQRSVATQCISL